MKFSMGKTIATVLSLLLMLSITATLIPLPAANAHDPAWDIPTYAYVTASPSTVGVGQYTLIVMFLDKYPPTAGGAGGDRWRGFTLTITKPNGDIETIPYTGETSQTGTAFITYTPDQVGDYNIVFSWPGQTLSNGTGVPDNSGVPFVGDHYEASTSDPFILHVQQEPVAEWVETPLPTSYWTRPLNDANREWSMLASNWLQGSQFRYRSFQEYGQAPATAHIMWTRPLALGGITDAEWSGIHYGTMDYEFPWIYRSMPIIIDGQIFLNTPMYPKYGYYDVDLQTGQLLWSKNGTDNGLNNPVTLSLIASGGATGPALTQTFPQLSFGQTYYYQSVNGHGTVPYLWMTVGSTWYMLDADTGNLILTLTNVPGGTAITDQDGSLLRYSYNANTGNFLCWNSSQSIPPGGPTGTAQAQWKPMVGAVINAVNDTIWTQYPIPNATTVGQTPWYAYNVPPRSGYTMNVTGPIGLPTSMNVLQDENKVPKLMVLSYLSGGGPLNRFGSNEQRFEVAVVSIDDHVAPYSPYPDQTGTQNNNLGFGVTVKWDKNFTYPLGGNKTWSLGPMSYEDNVFTLWCKETRQWWGYSLTDGSPLWGPTPSQSQWDVYGNGAVYAYGTLFSGSYGGVVHAYNMTTGQQMWNYTLNQIGYESPYGNYPCTISAICDGKIYVTSGEHSPTNPLWRGSYLRCINATNGKEIWKLLDYSMFVGISDGYAVTGSMYDTQMYCIGKGPSATTVEAPMTAITEGNSAVIKGTVMDKSTGATSNSVAALFPNGLPCVSDADQEAWMEYVYEQQVTPENATGVPVTLDAIDPNGNFIHLGTITSDTSGNFGFNWETPNVPGKYNIIATFEGSNSYYPSYAETYAVVTEAPAASPTPTPPPALMTDTYVASFGIAMIIVLIVGIVVIILMLRKR